MAGRHYFDLSERAKLRDRLSWYCDRHGIKPPTLALRIADVHPPGTEVSVKQLYRFKDQSPAGAKRPRVGDDFVSLLALFAESIPEPPQIVPGVWYSWEGGECPVPLGTIVHVGNDFGGTERCGPVEPALLEEWTMKGGVTRFRVIDKEIYPNSDSWFEAYGYDCNPTAPLPELRKCPVSGSRDRQGVE